MLASAQVLLLRQSSRDVDVLLRVRSVLELCSRLVVLELVVNHSGFLSRVLCLHCIWSWLIPRLGVCSLIAVGLVVDAHDSALRFTLSGRRLTALYHSA